MVIFPISTLAREQCANPDGNGPVCHQETVDTIVVPTEKTKAFDITTLYYSGSILSNQSSSYEFSSPLEGPIKVELYDILGRLIYTVEKFPSNNIITINNLFFPEGEYFAKLTTNNFTYTTNLLKSK